MAEAAYELQALQFSVVPVGIWVFSILLTPPMKNPFVDPLWLQAYSGHCLVHEPHSIARFYPDDANRRCYALPILDASIHHCLAHPTPDAAIRHRFEYPALDFVSCRYQTRPSLDDASFDHDCGFFPLGSHFGFLGDSCFCYFFHDI